MRRARRWRLAVATLLAFALARAPAARAAPAPKVKVEELCKALLEDSNYKVRVQAAIVLGRLGDSEHGRVAGQGARRHQQDGARHRRPGAGPDRRRGGGRPAARRCSRRELDPFVKGQAEKALASLRPSSGATALAASGSLSKKAKIYLSFGPFTGTSKTISADAAKIVRDVLQRELGKLQVVTTNISPGDQKNFAKSGLLGFYIDGNVTRLDDIVVGRRLGDVVRRQGAGRPLAVEEHHLLDQRGRERAVGIAAARQGRRAPRLPRGVGRPARRGPHKIFQIARWVARWVPMCVRS